MLTEVISGKLLDAALTAAQKLLFDGRDDKVTLQVSPADIEAALYQHTNSINTWSRAISFNDLKKAKDTMEVFIELDLFVYPIRIRIDSKETIESIPLTKIFETVDEHIVLLGQPGAGKTTSLKFLCQTIFTDEQFCIDRFNLPLLIKFRELRDATNPNLIIDQLYNILGLRLHFPEPPQTKNIPPHYQDVQTMRFAALKERLVIKILEELKVLLMLDGFDELMSQKLKDNVINEIRRLASQLQQCTMLITSRTADFSYSLENVVPFEICSLNEDQISMFAHKWLPHPQAAEFISGVQNSPFADTTIRPLTLAHLCAIYERIGKIPEKPKTAYRKIINLLLEEWDDQRSIKRLSRYATFESDRKFDFLCRLAFEFTTALKTTIFSKYDLLRAYSSICAEFDLPGDEAKQVVAELESHTGLFLESGYEQFEFAHKSLQEYLTAEYLVKLPFIPVDSAFLKTIPNEIGIAVALSSNPSEYLRQLIFDGLKKRHWTKEFIRAFVNRLLLEKPDFNRTREAGVTLIQLYTLYVRYCFFGANSSEFAHNKNTIDLELLLRRVLHGEHVNLLRRYYEPEQVWPMENQDHLFRLVKKEFSEQELLKPQITLSSFLYVRESFLGDWAKSPSFTELS